jgi:HD superfamily phosphohydrolase
MNQFVSSTNPDINYLKSKKHQIGNIYNDVRVDKLTGLIYFSNPSHLYDFLLLRALLHQNVYLHPINQGRDMVIANIINPFYCEDNSQTKFLTPLKLRKMTDNQLIDDLAKRYNKNSFGLLMELESWQPEHYEEFLDFKSAQYRATELKTTGKTIYGIKECKGFKPSTNYKIIDRGKNIIPYKDFDHQKSLYLQEIADSTKKVYLYYQD